MRKPMIARVTEVTVTPNGEPLFCEGATVIRLVDEAAGEYVTVRQSRDSQMIEFDEREWPAIRFQIDLMIEKIRSHDDAS